MRLFILFFSIGLSMLLAACSTAPGKTFLLLQPPQQTSQIEIVHPVKKLNVQLSEYLNRPALAIATESGEVQFSEQYQWAERLDIALADILQQQINQSYPKKTKDHKYQLQIFVQRFHSNQAGTMVLKGEYVLRNVEGQILEQAGFSLKEQFHLSNYNDIAKKMLDMTRQLSILISHQIQALESD